MERIRSVGGRDSLNSLDVLYSRVQELINAHNERLPRPEPEPLPTHPSWVEPNQSPAKQPPRENIWPKNILPSGKALWEQRRDRLLRLFRSEQFESPAVTAAISQLATIEAVCRWLEREYENTGLGNIMTRLRADAQARVEEARKG